VFFFVSHKEKVRIDNQENDKKINVETEVSNLKPVKVKGVFL